MKQQTRICAYTMVVLCMLFGATACGVTTGTTGAGAQPMPTSTTVAATASATSASSAAFTVTGVDLAVNPSSIAGKACGSSATFMYTATFHIPANTAGGTIQFMYTTTNGRGSTAAHVTVPAGATTATYSFTASGVLPPDHTFPGIAEVVVTSPGSAHSPQVSVSGSCSQAAFTVTSVDMSVHPTTVSNIQCGTTLSVTWTATFHIPANSPGGTIQLEYSWNEGRASYNGSVNVPPGATTATFAFTHTDKVQPDHSFPQYGSVHVISPNALISQQITPSGTCHS